MKVLRTLEFSAGIATFLGALLVIYFISIPESKAIAELYHEPFNYSWTRAFLFLVIPSLLIAISSYFHAFRNNYIGLAVIIILGGAITFLHLIAILSGTAFEGHPLIGTSEGFFAFLTIILALINTMYLSIKYDALQ